MSIIIRNLGGDTLGICDYEIRINERRITTFKHNRLDGLGVCLELASKAVTQQMWLDAARVLETETREFISSTPANPTQEQP